MKINNITSRPNFGYNAEYHKKYQETLSKRKSNQQLAKTLIELDKTSLMIEDEIVAMENGKTNCLKNEQYNSLTEFLIEIKNIIGYFSALGFNSLKYNENVIDQYYIESVQKKDMHIPDWRSKLCAKLATYTVDYYGKDFAIKKEKTKAPITEKDFQPEETKEEKEAELEAQKSQTLGEVAQQAVDDYINKVGEKLLTLYKPTESSPRGFNDVVGMDKLKEELNEEIINYIIDPDLLIQDYVEYGIRPPRGFLFWGPPGCGKTFIAQALAQESGMDMYRLDVSKIGSKYVNQSANNLEGAFEFLKYKASKQDKPILLFMDEVDSLAKNRSNFAGDSSEDLKVVTTLLKHVEQARDNNIITIAATNKHNLLDEAFVSRFDGQKYIGLPEKEQIINLIKKNLSTKEKGAELALNEDELNSLADEMIGYSNRSIVFILDNAAKIARKDSRSDISAKHIKQALDECDFDKIDESKYEKNRKKSNKIGFNI
ncbi:MAG: ATP-binding protein [Candidatus Gastranaerophilales bacterium]|nr:ATP-binding protein [Candidatus Gastranaerophilales bacterium]